MKKLDDQSHKFAHLLSAMQVIAAELEQQKLNFKSVRTFANRPTVVKALSDLSEIFSEELKPYA